MCSLQSDGSRYSWRRSSNLDPDPDLSDSPGCRSRFIRKLRLRIQCESATTSMVRPKYPSALIPVLNPTVGFTNVLKLMIAGWKASEVPRCHRTETAGGGEERGVPDDQQRAAQAGTQVSPLGQRGDRLHQASPRGSNHNQVVILVISVSDPYPD